MYFSEDHRMCFSPDATLSFSCSRFRVLFIELGLYEPELKITNGLKLLDPGFRNCTICKLEHDRRDEVSRELLLLLCVAKILM